PSRVRISYPPPHRGHGTAIGGRGIDTETAVPAPTETAPPVPGARRAAALLTASVATFGLSAALGPSSAEPSLPASGQWPPYSMDVGPSELTVTVLLAVGLVVGALGLHAAWRAVDRGWRPSPRRLLAASLLATAALCLVPTIGSSDIVSYATYGRMAATGHDPYSTTPEMLARAGDPIAVNVQGWLTASSVYGPLATAEQSLASHIGGRSLRTTVVMLTVFNALGYALTTILLYAGCRTEARRRRAMLLWGANPLLLFELVSAGHVDAWATMFAVAAVLALRRGPLLGPLLAGALVGAAIDVKLSMGVVALGLVVALWRRWGALAAAALGCVAVVVPAYVAAGRHVLDQAGAASTFVVHASVWQPIALLMGGTGWRRVVTSLAWIAVAALAVVLLRRQRAFAAREPDIARRAASAIAAVLTAYLLLSAYVLPWYDAPLWAMLALLPATAVDRVLLVHTGVLAVAYLPGNSVALTSRAVRVGQFVVQRIVAPPVFAVLVYLTARAGDAATAASHDAH
ncbi:MAG: glycosyltransferase family 39 protein, partial [Frankiales bacterium]|nr:glycosyltransferase family 39 protein [Frankiales bacterium]